MDPNSHDLWFTPGNTICNKNLYHPAIYHSDVPFSSWTNCFERQGRTWIPGTQWTQWTLPLSTLPLMWRRRFLATGQIDANCVEAEHLRAEVFRLFIFFMLGQTQNQLKGEKSSGTSLAWPVSETARWNTEASVAWGPCLNHRCWWCLGIPIFYFSGWFASNPWLGKSQLTDSPTMALQSQNNMIKTSTAVNSGSVTILLCRLYDIAYGPFQPIRLRLPCQ